jgi:hypothetical protein
MDRRDVDTNQGGSDWFSALRIHSQLENRGRINFLTVSEVSV